MKKRAKPKRIRIFIVFLIVILTVVFLITLNWSSNKVLFFEESNGIYRNNYVTKTKKVNENTSIYRSKYVGLTYVYPSSWGDIHVFETWEPENEYVFELYQEYNSFTNFPNLFIESGVFDYGGIGNGVTCKELINSYKLTTKDDKTAEIEQWLFNQEQYAFSAVIKDGDNDSDWIWIYYFQPISDDFEIQINHINNLIQSIEFNYPHQNPVIKSQD